MPAATRLEAHLHELLVEGAGGPVHSGAPALEQLVPVGQLACAGARAQCVRSLAAGAAVGPPPRCRGELCSALSRTAAAVRAAPRMRQPPTLHRPQPCAAVALVHHRLHVVGVNAQLVERRFEAQRARPAPAGADDLKRHPRRGVPDARSGCAPAARLSLDSRCVRGRARLNTRRLCLPASSAAGGEVTARPVRFGSNCADRRRRQVRRVARPGRHAQASKQRRLRLVHGACSAATHARTDDCPGGGGGCSSNARRLPRPLKSSPHLWKQLSSSPTSCSGSSRQMPHRTNAAG
jgi:hypothetical protein